MIVCMYVCMYVCTCNYVFWNRLPVLTLARCIWWHLPLRLYYFLEYGVESIAQQYKWLKQDLEVKQPN